MTAAAGRRAAPDPSRLPARTTRRIVRTRAGRCATPSATAATCGWSTPTTCRRLPRRAAAAGPLRARDHFGAPGPIDPGQRRRATWPRRGIDLAGGRVLMLGQRRASLGHVFNPLSLYWCYRRRRPPGRVLAEVHNTYGERHVYLLRPDDGRPGRGGQGVLRLAVLAAGRPYRMRLPEPGRAAAAHHGPGAATARPPFTATVRGVRRPSTAARRCCAACSGTPVAPRGSAC